MNKRKFDDTVNSELAKNNRSLKSRARAMWATVFDSISGRSAVVPTGHVTPATAHEQQFVDWILRMGKVGYGPNMAGCPFTPYI